jgi:hypothetical protein
VKGTFTRRLNACIEVVESLENSDTSSCSTGTITRLENLLSGVEDSLQRLESASDDMLDVWDGEEYDREVKILEDVAKKVQHIRFRIIDLTAHINAGQNPSSNSLSSQSDSRNERPVRINEALKPERLTIDATLAEFRAWQTNFDLFHSSNHMDKFPSDEQQGYLRSCLDLKLSQLLSTKVDSSTPLYGNNGCIDVLRQIFLQIVPVLTRRYNFFKCDQKSGEKFSDWFLRLQLEGQEAELSTIDEDYLYVLRLVTGTNDKRLREEFLRQSNPSRDNLYKIGIAWESASLIETSLESSMSKSSIATIARRSPSSSRQRSQSRSQRKQSFSSKSSFTNVSDLKEKCPGCGQQNPSHRRRECPTFSKFCNSCGRRGHFQSVCTGGRFVSNRRPHEDFRLQKASKAKAIETSVIRVKTCNQNEFNKSTPLLSVIVVPCSGKPFSMQALPDTGATESLISSDLVSTYGISLKKSRKLNIVAGNDTKLNCLGVVQLKVYLESDKTRKFGTEISAFVTDDLTDEFLISWHHLISLGVIPKSFPSALTRLCVSSESSEISSPVTNLFDQFSSVFETTGQSLKPMHGSPMHIHIKDDVNIKPTHVTTARNIPYAYHEKVEQELSFMVSSGIIEPVDQPST